MCQRREMSVAGGIAISISASQESDLEQNLEQWLKTGGDDGSATYFCLDADVEIEAAITKGKKCLCPTFGQTKT
jgi:hypothetical protein